MPDKKYPGIRWDAERNDYRITVEIGTGTRAKRLRATTRMPKDTPISAMKRWQEATRVRLRASLDEDQALQPAPLTADTVTVRQAMDAYLSTITAMPAHDSYQSYARMWCRAKDQDDRPLGPQPIAAVKPSVWKTAWSVWQAKGNAPSTLNHRRTFLLATLRLYDVDHKTTLEDAARKVLPFTAKEDDVPAELPWPVIDAVLKAMPRSHAWAFLSVMAETGLPPQTLRNLTPDAVNERRRTMRLPVRQKGRTVAGVVLTLTDEAAAAFRTYRAMGWRPVCAQTLGDAWQRACVAVRRGRYPDQMPHQYRGTLGPPLPVIACSPYVLRHSFAGRVLDDNGGDLHALKPLLQHKSYKQTERYGRGREHRAAKEAIRKLNAGNKHRRGLRVVGKIPPKDPAQRDFVRENRETA